jgi:hypothetical protein
MSNSFTRILKLADAFDASGDMEGLARLCVQFDAYIKKCAHYAPINDGTTPNPLRLNMDYSGWENSPYYGSMSEFMEKFPGGIPDWLKWRKETQKERFLMWSKTSSRRDDIRKKIAEGAPTNNEAIYKAMFTKYDKLLKQKSRQIATNYIQENRAASEGAEELRWESIQNNSAIYLKVLDGLVEKEIQANNLGAAIQSLMRFRGTAKYKKYVDLFYNMLEYIANAAMGKFGTYLGTIKAPGFAADDEEPFVPTTEETVESLTPPTDEERIKARELIEKILQIVSKEEAELLLEESASKGTIIEAHFVPVGPDDTKKFPDEPHLYSDEGLKRFKSITEYLKKYRGQEANDLSGAASKAIKDFINYWKLLQKSKGRRKKKGKK